MMNGNWVSYQNGNYTVSIDLDTGLINDEGRGYFNGGLY